MSDSKAQATAAKDRGNQLFKDGDLKGALEAFTEAISHDGSNEVFYSNRSAVQRALGALEDAVADAQKAIELKPDWVRGHARAAAAYQQLGDLDTAKKAYEQALRCDPNDQVSAKGLQDLERAESTAAAAMGEGPAGGNEEGDFTMGLLSMLEDASLWEAIKKKPEVAALLSNPATLAKIDALKKDPKQMQASMGDPAVGAILQALLMATLEKSNPGIFQQMQQAQQGQQGGADSAPAPSPSRKAEPPKKKEEPVVVLSPEQQQAVALKEAGNKHYSLKEWEQAIEKYSQAVELDPDNLLYRLNRASVHMMTSHFDECIAECDEALAHGKAVRAPFDQMAKAYHRKGRCYLRLNDLDAAIKAFDQSMTEHRTAECLKDLRDTERLREKRIAEAYLDPQLSLEAKERGAKLFQEGKMPEAIQEFSEAIKRNPKDHTIFSNRSFAYLKLGAFAEALSDAEHTIKLDPTFIKGYIRKAQVHHRAKDYHKAVATYEDALRVDPESVAVKEGLQETLRAIQERRMSGKIDKAVQERAMADPEIQKILSNPEVQTFLRESQTNPKGVQEMLRKRPALAKSIDTLMAAGAI
ncbi:MAG: tetratricopeptide repeat protein [archaeon]|nr:tetratricopeptide repeat protein [archaeon]